MRVLAVGVHTPLGTTPDALWDAIEAGRDGFVDVERFAVDGLPGCVASAFSAEQVAEALRATGQEDPALAYGVSAGRAALAGCDADQLARTVLVCATSAGAADLHQRYDRLRTTDPTTAARLRRGGAFAGFGRTLAAALGVRLITTASTACASGGHALGLAADLLREGVADRALVVGADSVHPWLFAGFHSVGALARGRCAPFGEHFGMALGEGGGAVLLAAGDGPALGHLLGWGGSCDAYHVTSPDPRGEGMGRSLRAALADAGLRPDEVDAYNAHGTGTEANDPAETHAVREVLGQVPVSATKSQLGHTQGAAGVLEAIVALWGLRRQVLPPSLRSVPARRIAPADTVPVARPHPCRVALSHSAAFGGTNVTVALGLEPRPRAERPSEPVYVAGVGAVGPFGSSAGHALEPVGEPPVAPRVRVPRADPVSALLGQAVGAALADAGLQGTLDDVGLVVGMSDGPQSSIRRFVDSCDQDGPARASAAAFGRMVLNAPAGVAATASQVRGPNLTVWGERDAGAQAVLAAARLLRQHAELAGVVAAGADEVGHLSRDRAEAGELPAPPVGAASALVLCRRPGPVVLAGEATGTALEAVVAEALGGTTPDRVIDAAVVSKLGHAPAASGALACAAAVEWIRAGRAATVLVVAGSEGVVCALLFAATDRAIESPRGQR
ncbi:MAG: hypothetical protein H6735_07500 [Alphaproteobacteria bacterium]|nr:hypothetical protein [Alphaproteobacteria bacterium]